MKIRFLILMCIGVLLSCNANAAQVMYAEQTQDTMVEQVTQNYDNFIVFFDASGSMAENYPGMNLDKVSAAKKVLFAQNMDLKDLPFKAGLYTFTPFKPYYDFATYDQGEFGSAMQKLPNTKTAGTYADQPTPLNEGLDVLGSLIPDGRTAVFFFTDGQYSDKGNPVNASKTLAQKDGVCITFISLANTARHQKLIDDMASSDECFEVVSGKDFDEDYIASTLYSVTMTKKEGKQVVMGLGVDNVLFDFDKAIIKGEFKVELDKVGQFLQQHPEMFAVVEGHTDSIGTEEYNIRLSVRRAQSVQQYLVENFGIMTDRVEVKGFGEAVPVASNKTEKGRAQNRRVEVKVYRP